MKITIVYQYFGTSNSKWSTRWYDFALEFKNLGHEVTIITSNFVRSDLPKVSFLKKKIVIDGINIIILPFGDGNNFNIFSRIVRSFFFTIISSISVFFRKTDILICSSGPISAAVPLLVPSKSYKILEVRDLWPHGAFEMKKIPNFSIIKNILFGLEKLLYLKVNKVVTCSPAQKCYLENRYKNILNNKIMTIEHGLDNRSLDYFNNFKKQNVINHEKFWIVSATMGFIHNPYRWLKFSKILATLDDSITLVLIGGGPLFEEIKYLAKKDNLSNIVLTGQISKDEMNTWLNKAEFCLFTTLNNSIQKTCAPNKIYDYLAFEVPILIDIDMWLLEKYSDFIWEVNFKDFKKNDLEFIRNKATKISIKKLKYHKNNLLRANLAARYLYDI